MYADFQNEIYLNGLADVVPALPTDLTRLEALAKEKLSRRRMTTSRARPVRGTRRGPTARRSGGGGWSRGCCAGSAGCDLSTNVLGRHCPSRCCSGPIGVMRQLHPEGELAVARAAESLGVTMVLSTAASHTMEEVAEVAGSALVPAVLAERPGPRGQLPRPRQGRRATPRSSSRSTRSCSRWRPYDLDNAYLPFLRGLGNQNYFSDPVFAAGAGDNPILQLGVVVREPLA